MAETSALTARPVLGGFVPGVTVTVRSVASPAARKFGVAAPTPLGLVEPAQGARGLAVFRGFGAPVAKSVLLLSVSVQPPPAGPRSAAVVLPRLNTSM